MKYVFVETNWVVDYAAPTYFKVELRDADSLLEQAQAGEFQLQLPSICITESRRAIQTRFATKQAEADKIRAFLRWSRRSQFLDEPVFNKSILAVEKMEVEIERDIASLDQRLQDLASLPGLYVFDVDSECAARCSELSYQGLDLKPFDQMILASILVRSARLAAGRKVEFSFCQKDQDLQPWGGSGISKKALVKLYDEAGIWVYGDFLQRRPERPSGWPGSPI